ncbi:uncharacterized protein [Atheta coriaria]|uniref:uncharacterized protein n=1 Tax=Dalotia coriaria TaxID=877792 RepID=UPI0031F3CA35
MGNTLKYEAMELSSLEKKIIIESWLALRRKLSKCGQTFILIFLDEHPEYLALFPIKYRGNPDLAEILGLKVMRELSRIISNLDGLSGIAGYLRGVAENHQRRHINSKAYDDFRLSYLKMLRKHLAGYKHMSLYLQCWDKLLRLINTIVLDIITDIEKKAPASQVKLNDQSGQIQITPKYEPVERSSTTVKENNTPPML